MNDGAFTTCLRTRMCRCRISTRAWWMLFARPNASILYSTLARGPKLSREDQLNSSRLFMRELNRLGLTSVIDAGGGFQNYPDDYAVVEELHRRGEMTLRIAYNLFTQRPKQELADFSKWIGMTSPGKGDDILRMNGAELCGTGT